MARTGSTPPNLPPWSAPDSIGYAVWNRLTQYSAPPREAGITVSGNTSAIHERHISFIGTLTAQPPGLSSTAAPRRVDDMRVFRRAAVSAAAIVGQRWPISISNAAIADSTRTGIPPQAATVIRGEILAPSFTTNLAREIPPIIRVSEAYAPAVAPTTRSEPSASIITGVESRLVRQKNSPVIPLATTNATVALTPDAMADGPSAPVLGLLAPAGVVRALLYNTGTLGRSSLVLRSAAGSAPVPLSPPIAVDRRRALVPSLLTGAHAVVVREIATPTAGNPPVLVSRPTSAPLSTAMSFVPQSPLALARISDAGLLQQTDVLSRMASPPSLANDVRRPSGVAATVIRSITYPSITQPSQYNETILSRAVSKPVYRAVILENRVAGTDAARRAPVGLLRNDRHRLFPVASLPIDASISVGPITREYDADRQMIQSAVSLYAHSTMPEFRPAETGILPLPQGPMATRQTEGARVAASSSSISLQSGLVVPPLELRNRRDGPERSVLRVAPPDVSVASAKIALSERPVDLPVGASPAAPGSLALLGPQQVVPQAVGDQAFPLVTLARASLSPTAALEDLAVTSHDVFVSSPSDGGSAGAIVPTPSALLPPRFASAGRSPLAQVDRTPGYFERSVLRVAPPDVSVASAKIMLSERPVDLPVGSSPAAPGSLAVLGTQQVVPRAVAVGDQAFPLATLARASVSSTALEDLAVTSHDIFVSSPLDGGSAGAIVPAHSASLLPRFASAGRSPLAQVDRAPRYFESGVLWVAPQDVGVTRAKTALSERSVDLPVGTSQVLSTRSAFPEVQLEAFPAKGDDVSVFPLADVVRSPAAQQRQAESPVISDSIISAIGGAGEPMKFTLSQPRFAGTTWPLTRPLAGVVRSPEVSPAAQLPQAEPPMISDSLIAAAGRTGEPMVFTSAEPRFGDSTSPLARSLTAPEVVGRHASGGSTIFGDRPSQWFVGGPSAHRAFDDRGSSFPSGSDDTFSTEPQRSDLPLRLPTRRYGVAMPSLRSGAAPAQIDAATTMLVARAESLGSAPYDQPGSTLTRGPGTSVDVGPRSDISPSAPSPDSGADADDIIERAWREVISRLAIEQERRGFGRWS
jgi:hypothetical protein